MNAVGFTIVSTTYITIKYLSLFSLDTNIKNLNTPDIGTVLATVVLDIPVPPVLQPVVWCMINVVYSFYKTL